MFMPKLGLAWLAADHFVGDFLETAPELRIHILLSLPHEYMTKKPLRCPKAFGVAGYKLCDGHSDCADMEDEKTCPKR